jgi:predicted regulator of Ras-like GTPase activity (Roadblock/LC7/MglB family)
MTTGKSPLLDALIETRGVKGAYEVDTDGFLLGSIDIGGQDRDAVAAVAAVTMISSERLGEVLNLGDLAWIMLEFSGGKMIMARKDGKIWVVATNNHCPIGDVIMKIRERTGSQEPRPA